MKPTLLVPSRLLTSEPSEKLTGAERAVAMEIAGLLDDLRQQPQVDDVVWLEVPTGRLRGPGRDDNQHLHRCLSRLARVQWRGQDPDGTRYVAQLIAQADIAPSGDTVRLLLPPRAVRFLRSPGNFAILDRAAVYSLKGHARTLYGLLKDRFNRPDKLSKHEAMWSLDELRGLLGLVGKYERFNLFRMRVLDPAVKAINETGALAVTMEPVKWGRSVSSVCFTLRPKEPDEQEATKRQVQRHSKAKGKTQESADAPPLIVQDRVLRYLDAADATERQRWAKRALELGAPETPAMSLRENIPKWARFVALEMVTDGIIQKK
jgi:hypothetical protein